MNNYDQNKMQYYNEDNDAEFRYLNVLLTPASLLRSNERYARANLYKEYDTEIYLELIHDRGNEYDRKALEVYYNRTFIGHIRKRFDDEDIDNTRMVNDFCFDVNRLIDDIELIWDGEAFRLRRKTQQTIEEDKEREIERLSEQKKADKEASILARERESIESKKRAKITSLKDKLNEMTDKKAYLNYMTKPDLFDKISAAFNGGDYGSYLKNEWVQAVSDLEYNLAYLEGQHYGTYETSELKNVTTTHGDIIKARETATSMETKTKALWDAEVAANTPDMK